MTASLKSFVDVLFILLLGTIVMLAQSVRLGAIEAAPLRLDERAVAGVRTDAVDVVVVDAETLVHDQRVFASTDDLAPQLRAPTVLLVVADVGVRHHRVMNVWSALSGRGLSVGLGAEPRATAGATPGTAPGSRDDDPEGRTR